MLLNNYEKLLCDMDREKKKMMSNVLFLRITAGVHWAWLQPSHMRWATTWVCPMMHRAALVIILTAS